DLLALALDLRLENGEQPTPAEYCAVMPQHADLIQRVFDEADWERSVTPRLGFLLRKSDQPTRPCREFAGASTGRYILMEEIGRGGMGAVMRARDCDLARELAVKVPLDTHRNQPNIEERFLLEAQVSGQL